MMAMKLNVRSRELKPDSRGYNSWHEINEVQEIAPGETALLICDVWDNHWSKSATERLNKMVPRMNEVVKAAREKGIQIIHAPSDTLDFYLDDPARTRMEEITLIQPEEVNQFKVPALPIDDSDGGSETNEDRSEHVNMRVWTRQHEGIEIDQEKDVISDLGMEIYSFLKQKGIKNYIIMGVHTNMCILNRGFGIIQMLKWGFNVYLVRDLTDAIYNPEMPPYVNLEEATRMMVEYIEKFLSPSISSDDLLKK
ncbi:MAG: isochorismatase family protein [Candidatus Hodarchaeota archaeon]